MSANLHRAQSDGHKAFARPHSIGLQRHRSVNLVRESPSVPCISTARTAVIAVVLFLAAHFALLVGVTTPEKFYFDEVHYVPAARQMLEPVMSSPMLNPMHPPLAKQLIALSIRAFGDEPLGWRYPGVVFGSLAIVAMYFCGLALFAAQGPAIASALLAFFNQMLFVQSRIAMLDIFSLAFTLFAIAAFLQGFRKTRPQPWFALAGIGFAAIINQATNAVFGQQVAFHLHPPLIGGCLVVGLAVTVLAALVPANRAVRLSSISSAKG